MRNISQNNSKNKHGNITKYQKSVSKIFRLTTQNQYF